MSAQTTEAPVEQKDSHSMRQTLQDAGWRSLTAANDPRRGPGTEGAECTIAWYPEFKDLGVPTAMVRVGRHDHPEGSRFVEIYRRTGSVWMPV